MAESDWTEHRRSDGAFVRPTLGGKWQIVLRQSASPITHCPCCGAFMLTERAAKLVADGVYPIPALPQPEA